MGNKRTELAKALGVTAELTATELSTDALRIMVMDLERFPLEQVLAALTRCRRELRGRLSIADIITRLEDGRPGVEEAWAMLPKDEAVTVVWTPEMAAAYGAASPLIPEDMIAARMAFKEAYTTAVTRARDGGAPVSWVPCLGHDPHGREGPLLQAAKEGKLTSSHVASLLPYCDPLSGNSDVAKLLEGLPKQLPRQEKDAA